MSAPPTTTNAADAGSIPQPARAQQLNRSCESCRSLKVRCLPDPSAPNHCQRCTRAKRACVFVAPQRRRPRKRTDSRVAQLEREMRAMRSLLKDRFRGDESSAESVGSEKEGSHDRDITPEPQENLPAILEAPGSSTSGSTRHMNISPGLPSSGPNTLDGHGGSLSAPSFTPMPSSAYSPDLSQGGEDVVDRGVISLEYANDLLLYFIHELTPFFPAVVLPPDTTAASLRRTKPVLFLSVIAAAAIAVDSTVGAILNREMVRLYSDRFFIEGDKSLELVQALLLMIVFYLPPPSPLKLQQYQYTHIAATMALEIGLASKRRVSKKSNNRKGEYGAFDEHMAEQARAIMGCYHLTAAVAMKTRRPNLLLFNNWMGECVKHLEQSPNTIDRRMAAWFELQRITDEAMVSFGLDDTSSTTPLTESRVQAVLRWFDNRLQSWKNNTPAKMLTVPMTLEYHHTNLAVYELAVGEGYRDPDAIKKEYYTLPPLEEDGNGRRAPLSAVRVDITVKWLNAAHQMLDFFLSCDTDTMRKIPNIMYQRVGVAMMSLLKIYFSVRSGAMAEVVTPEAVNVDAYLDAMSRKLTEAGDGRKYEIPTRWHYVLAVKARQWYDRFQKRQAEKDAGLTPPMNPGSASTAAPTSMPMSQQAQFEPVDPSQMGSYGMGVGVSQMPTFGHSNQGYGVPTSMGAQWPSDHNNQLFNMHQFASYAPAQTVPPQYVYETPQTYPPNDTSQQRNVLTPGTGMELDGWVPDGSIFGMSSLPEF